MSNKKKTEIKFTPTSRMTLGNKIQELCSIAIQVETFGQEGKEKACEILSNRAKNILQSIKDTDLSFTDIQRHASLICHHVGGGEGILGDLADILLQKGIAFTNGQSIKQLDPAKIAILKSAFGQCSQVEQVIRRKNKKRAKRGLPIATIF